MIMSYSTAALITIQNIRNMYAFLIQFIFIPCLGGGGGGKGADTLLFGGEMFCIDSSINLRLS